jgi:Sulfotransferase family
LAVHVIHVGKAGGTVLRHTLRKAKAASGGVLLSQWGPIWAHKGHRYALRDVPRNDKAIFSLRDPITRYISGFYSRQRKGQPRLFREWSDEERQSFEWFQTPEELADALAQPPGVQRRRAEYAMRSIRHVSRPMTHWTGTPAYLRRNLGKVLYIARQETLADDWERIKELLGLPPDLMLLSDPVAANRTEYPRETVMSTEGAAALKRWFAVDYELLEVAEDFRQGRAPRSRRALAVLPDTAHLGKRLRRRAYRLKRAVQRT